LAVLVKAGVRGVVVGGCCWAASCGGVRLASTRRWALRCWWRPAFVGSWLVVGAVEADEVTRSVAGGCCRAGAVLRSWASTARRVVCG